MSLMDHILFYDEDHDIGEEEMPEFTLVEPQDLLDLYHRGLLTVDEIFAHKGWYHLLLRDDSGLYAEIWDGPSGEVWVLTRNLETMTWD